MREEVRAVERLNHMLEAINVLINYKNHHTLEDSPCPAMGDHCYRHSRNKTDNRAVDSARKVGIRNHNVEP
jgi:hypothetical protein